MKRMRSWIVVMRRGAIGEALYAKIIVRTDMTLYPHLTTVSDFNRYSGRRRSLLTVDVISAEHESQTYLTPPSPPRVAVFLRITPISPSSSRVKSVWASQALRSSILLAVFGRSGKHTVRQEVAPGGVLHCRMRVAQKNGGPARHVIWSRE